MKMGSGNGGSASGLPVRFGVFTLAGVVAALAAGATPSRIGPAGLFADDRFESRVRPVLIQECVPCHGAQRSESGLRLDKAPGAGWGVRIAAALDGTGKVAMPPSGRLDPGRREELTAWAKAGAPWPAAKSPGKPVDPRSHWSFRPVAHPKPPAVSLSAWSVNPIDRFVLARMQKAGLGPAPEADRRTMIRRATWETTGLLPTQAEVDAFLADRSPKAWETVVDRLLASPAYGERWARHWLDLVRYADTKGYIYTGEARYPFAWTYRDWVVDALNRDMPYDRFLRKQIAADLLPRESDRDQAALGFFTVGRRFVNNVPDVIDDRIDVLTRTTMGLTVSCARCHDHKFDPVPTTDYYALYQVLVSSTERFVPIDTKRPDPGGAYAVELRKREMALSDAFQAARAEARDRMRRQAADYLRAVPKVAELPGNDFYVILADDDINPALVRHWKEWLDSRAVPEHPVLGAWALYAKLPADRFAALAPTVTARAGWVAVVRGMFSKPPVSMDDVAKRYGEWFTRVDRASRAELSAGGDGVLADAGDEAARQVLVGADAPTIVPDLSIDEVEFLFNHSTRERLQNLKGKVDQWMCDSPDTPAHALALSELPAPRAQHVYRRGDPRLIGEAVSPHFPVAVGPNGGKALAGGAGRRKLAHWIADPTNPLVARVAVNRLWMHHFGQGLVRTPSDFGTRGASPTHPELLDWLASELVRGGWSQKRIHRLILLSRTWRQGKALDSKSRRVDPDNRLLARRDSRRMDLESMRDCALQATGELDRRLGGRSETLFGAIESMRRSVYGRLDRQKVDGPYRIFDFANPDQHTPQRHETTVPQQALWWLNGPFGAARAKALADRARAAGGSDENTLAAMTGWLYQRKPTRAEREMALEFLAGERRLSKEPGSVGLDALARLAQVLLMSNEFCHVD